MPLAFQFSLGLYKLQIPFMPAILFNFSPVKKLWEFHCKSEGPETHFLHDLHDTYF